MATWIIATLTVLLAAATLATVSRSPHGLVRVCDFPKLQIMALAALLAVATLVVLPWTGLTASLLAAQVMIVVTQSADIKAGGLAPVG